MNCPYCGRIGEFEFQTKDLSNLMNLYKPVDSEELLHCLLKGLKKPSKKLVKMNRMWKFWYSQVISNKTEILSNAWVGIERKCIEHTSTDCHSVSCQWDADREWTIAQGCPSGFGKQFEASFRVIKGYLVGKPINIKLFNDKYMESKLRDYKKHISKEYISSFNKIMKKKGQEVIVLREMKRG